MVKKFIVVILAAAQLFLLSGCWNYVEINQQLTVAGVALDIGNQGNRYHLSAEIVTAGKGEQSPFESHIMEAEGNTMFETVRALIAVSSKKLYFGHCKVMVIGEDLAKYGIRELLDMPIRDHEMRLEMNVVIAKGCTGKNLLQTKGITTTITSYKISDMLKTGAEKIGCVGMDKEYKIYDGLETEGLSVAIPAIEKQKVEGEDAVKLCGAGVFKDDHLIGFLSQKELSDLSIMKNQYKMGAITTESVENPFYNTSFEVFKNRTNTKVSCEADGTVVADVHVKTWVKVAEVQTRANYLDSAEVKKTQRLLQKNIEHDLGNLVKAAQETYRCDLFGIGQMIRQQNPAAWKKLGPDWEKRFPKVKFQIESEVVIIGSGILNEKGGT